MKNTVLIIFLVMILYSCQSEKEKQLIKYSEITFNNSIEKIKKSQFTINIDSFRVVYEEIKAKDAQKGLDFANRFYAYSTKLLQKREEVELAKNIEKSKRIQRQIERNIKERKVWENSKYGKLQKKHPEWSDEECINVIDNKIWIGMSLEMLKYQRGNPNRANPSNYGNGVKWQWCWDDYTPSCFYGQDGIITAYN
jgi:hypothetical protein